MQRVYNMTNFFEKLKKGMGVEVRTTEKEEKKPKQDLARPVSAPSGALLGQKVEEKVKKEGPALSLPKGAKIKGEKKEEIEVKTTSSQRGFSLENLNRQAGELAVDLYQNEEELIVRSAIAGVKPEKLDILIEQDVITIAGNREEPAEKGKIDYFARECYFGPFSRKIISPVEIDSSRAKAIMKEGILFIRIPKIQREKKVKVEIGKD